MTTADPSTPDALDRFAERTASLGLRFRTSAASATGDGVELRAVGEGLATIEVRRNGRAMSALVADPRCARPPSEALVVAASAEAERLASLLAWTLEASCSDLEQQAVVSEFCDQLSQSYEVTHTLFRALRLLSSTEDPASTIERLCLDMQRTLPFSWVALAFADSPRVVHALRGRLMLVGEAPADRAGFEAALAARVALLTADSWTKVLRPDRDELARRAGSEVVCEPVAHDETVVGLLAAGGKRGADREIATPEVQFLDATASFLGTFHENVARFDEQRAMTRATLESLVAAIDAKDQYTCGHSERVSLLAAQLAGAMGLSPVLSERIRLSGLVHDVGKIGVPEAILCKPGRPTDEEFAAIRRHPEIGYRILRGIAGFEDLLPGVLHHHERWDGRGYPHGLAGESIPLVARIIGLADAFDAMSSTRAYRSALPRSKVLAEVRGNAGSQFDPAAAEAFVSLDLQAYDDLLARHAHRDADPVRAAA